MFGMIWAVATYLYRRYWSDYDIEMWREEHQKRLALVSLADWLGNAISVDFAQDIPLREESPKHPCIAIYDAVQDSTLYVFLDDTGDDDNIQCVRDDDIVNGGGCSLRQYLAETLAGDPDIEVLADDDEQSGGIELLNTKTLKVLRFAPYGQRLVAMHLLEDVEVANK